MTAMIPLGSVYPIIVLTIVFMQAFAHITEGATKKAYRVLMVVGVTYMAHMSGYNIYVSALLMILLLNIKE